MIELIKIITSWRKQILYLTLFGMVAALVITMPVIMPPYYKSKMTFYLSNPVSTDRAALFNEKEGGGVSIFGGKEDINRFLSILNSPQVSFYIIDKYKLKQHYDIDAENKELAEFYAQREFSTNFKAIRNDLGAIEVTLEDKDANLASDMIKDIVSKSDTIYRGILVENKAAVLSLLDRQIASKSTVPQQGQSSLTSEELVKLNAIRDQYEVSASANFKTIYVVEEPKPAAKKSSPVRWLILLISTLASFVFAALTALCIELYKHADKYGFQRS